MFLQNKGLQYGLAGMFLISSEISTIEVRSTQGEIKIEQKKEQQKTLERILVRGLGATEPNEDINEWRDKFDAVVNLSSGNILFDLIKANAERQGTHVTEADLVGVQRANSYDVYAHSWGSESVYNTMRDGKLVPRRLVVINPPSRNFTKWENISEKTAIRIDMYLGTEDLVKVPGSTLDFMLNPGGYIIRLGSEGKKTDKGDVRIHAYEGGHTLKGALTHLDSKREFEILPSERIKIAHQVQLPEHDTQILEYAKRIREGGTPISIEGKTPRPPSRIFTRSPRDYPQSPKVDFDAISSKINSHFTNIGW